MGLLSWLKGVLSGGYDEYIVKSGDSLSKIAAKYPKSVTWQTIYAANRDQITHPDLIYPGQKLRIPRS